MMTSKSTPVVIGVGDIINRSLNTEDALEPLELMLQAISAAIDDTSSTVSKAQFHSFIDGIDIVATWTWPYHDLPGLLAQRLGIQPKHRHYSQHGGNQPAKLFDEAARRISRGESKVAIITGGEALASLSASLAKNKVPPSGWSTPNNAVESILSPTTRKLVDRVGATHQIGAPIHVYPLYENAFRARRGQSLLENHQESALMYAEFAKVAEQNPFAWNYGKPAETMESIATISKRNRMICYPYPLLMNAFNTVNLAAACVLTSTEYAEKLGVPRSKWIYPLGGAGTEERSQFWLRENFHSSPTISRTLDAGLTASGLTANDIDIFDLYSCFPIVPKLACHYLDLPTTGCSKPTTVLGGLTSFGGAGNNYSMHAITESVRQLRNGKDRNALILANGGVLTYQHVICLSSHPRTDGLAYPEQNPLPEILKDLDIPVFDDQAEGEAVIETYTVEFKKDGQPLRGHVVGRLKKNNHRFIANHADERTLILLASGLEEPIGQTGLVKLDDTKEGRNLFTLCRDSRL